MTQDALEKRYFDWLIGLVHTEEMSEDLSYQRLFSFLHTIEFTYTIQRDKNRAEDGLDLRYRFCKHNNVDPEFADCFGGPCSILEMIIALAVRCEESIMDDPRYGNRTSQWFWVMIRSLGFGTMYNIKFDEDKAYEIVERFLNREYEPDGRGGLFFIRDCDQDLRGVEIWCQLNWYLNKIA